LFKEQARYTAPFAVSGILEVVVRYFDKLICIRFMSCDEYALYAIAFFGIPGIQQIYSSIGDVYLVEMSKAFHENRRSDALQLLKNLEYKAVSCSLPVIAAVMIFAPEIISFFFTPKYIGASGYFRLYIFYFTFEVVASSLIARASGNTKVNLITAVASAVVSLPFTYFAVKYYGAWGGISGVLVGILLRRLLYVYFEMRIVGASLRNYFPWKEYGKIFSVTILGALPLACLQYYFRFNVWIGGVLSMIYLLISYYSFIRLDVFIVDRNYVKNLLARFGLGKLSEIF
jgi:O-antigen/teichoic acid export membrane protein